MSYGTGNTRANTNDCKKIMASFPEIYLSERKRVKMERNGKRNGSQAVTEAA